MQNNYDRIARYYDSLSRMIFFSAQVNAQVEQLRFIPANSRILIAGGGTGWILEEIANVHPSGLHITYIEISEKMLALSRKRDVKANKVAYLHASAEEAQLQGSYDVIMTAFLFDNFEKEKVKEVFGKFDGLLKDAGLWLFADFYYEKGSGKSWKWYLLKTMYLFFKQISDVEASMLIDTAQFFKQHHYKILKTNFYYSGFIKAIIYQKPD